MFHKLVTMEGPSQPNLFSILNTGGQVELHKAFYLKYLETFLHLDSEASLLPNPSLTPSVTSSLVRLKTTSPVIKFREVAMKTDGQDGSYGHSRMHLFLRLI